MTLTADRLREAMHSPIPPSELADHEIAPDSARDGLGLDELDFLRAEGRRADLSEGIRAALDEG